MRGNPGAVRGRVSYVGSIPACAGEPQPWSPDRRVARVYPRVCGGTTSPSSVSIASPGLSPRVRGNQRRLPPRRLRAGSIPACAGEPRFRFTFGLLCRVYPRVCGGTGYRLSPMKASPGLSPRVRGNRRRTPARALRAGSIPACAGEPSGRGPARDTGRVYPRVCGGTSISRTRDGSSSGLSPRVRGNQVVPEVAEHQDGSIPACAGEPARHRR